MSSRVTAASDSSAARAVRVAASGTMSSAWMTGIQPSVVPAAAGKAALILIAFFSARCAHPRRNDQCARRVRGRNEVTAIRARAALRNAVRLHQAGLRAHERCCSPGESPSRAWIAQWPNDSPLFSSTVAGAAPDLSRHVWMHRLPVSFLERTFAEHLMRFELNARVDYKRPRIEVSIAAACLLRCDPECRTVKRSGRCRRIGLPFSRGVKTPVPDAVSGTGMMRQKRVIKRESDGYCFSSGCFCSGSSAAGAVSTGVAAGTASAEDVSAVGAVAGTGAEAGNSVGCSRFWQATAADNANRTKSSVEYLFINEMRSSS